MFGEIIKNTRADGYQPGIDGLRGLSVLLILFFHVGFAFVPGGFVGVDVFFVISGYLITGIITRNHSLARFNYFDFLISRVFRLYPVLLLTIFMVFIFCFLLYSPVDFLQVSKSGLFSVISSSNILFAKKMGYFDNSSDIDPFLHTWSLAVEQQFYILWPVLLVFILRFKKLNPLFIVSVAFFILLLLSEHAIRSKPVGSYFLLKYRAFEFLAGAVLFFIMSGIKEKVRNLISEIFLCCGISSILFSAFWMSSETPFPGFFALLPVLGAALCILGCDAKFTGFIINNKIIVFLGVISYSIYLLHWPLIAIYRYWVFRDINFIEKISLILISILIASLAYVYVENRFRRPGLGVRKKSFLSIIAIGCVLMFLYAGTMHLNGFVFRGKQMAISSAFYGGDGIKQQEKIVLGAGNSKFIMMGDSYSRQYGNSVIEEMNLSHSSVTAFFTDGCFFSLSYTMLEGGQERTICKEMASQAIAYANDKKLPVVYAQSWTNYKEKIFNNGSVVSFSNEEEYVNFNIENVLSIARSIYPLNIYVIGSPPQAVTGVNSSVVSCITRPKFVYNPCLGKINNTEYLDAKYRSNIKMKERFSSVKNIKFIDPYDFLCKDGQCFSSVKDDVLYSDATHLSRVGAALVWKNIHDKYGL